MLLQERMKNFKFSPSERIVVDFILKEQELIADYSVTTIAGKTYTSPSILVRISKKLGFNGYNELKKSFLEEVTYLKKNFRNINANIPFTKNDSIIDIANKLTQLKQQSLSDTLSLIHHDTLQKTIRIMETSETIKVFTISNLTFQAEEFVYKLRRIGKKAETYSVSNNIYQEAAMVQSSDCAICISYSGESPELLNVVNFLKSNNIKIIAITSIGENSLSKSADVVLNITTREKSYSKIAGFSSLESISLILDLLYSCYFNTNYEKHYNYKLTLCKTTEFRQIDNKIIQDE